MAARSGVNAVRLIDSTTDAAVGARRSEVLAQLRAANGPLTVVQIAEQTGVHVNTARFHLDGLVADGHAERSVEARVTPGRPRMLYVASAHVPGPRSFGLLAEMLTGLVASLEGAEPAAIEAGRAWGRHLIQRPAPSERIDRSEALARLNGLLDALGFAPQTHAASGGDGVEVELHHCPFLEVAERHTDVVCRIHLGLMQGALAQLRAPLQADSLEPFVTPKLCIAQLKAAPARAC